MAPTVLHKLPAELAAENRQLRSQLAEQQELIQKLQHQLDWFKRQIFGTRSEKLATFDAALQLNLLGELAEPPAQPEEPAQAETISYQRRKGKPRGDAVNDTGLRFDDSVPVRVIDVKVPELSGPDAADYEIIDMQSTFRLAQLPGSYVVLNYRRPVLKNRRTEAMRTPPAPPSVLENTVADVSVLAGMLVDKFCFHLPLYRIHQRLALAGITLSRTTLTSWVSRAAQLLEPIYTAQLGHVVTSRVIAMDETPIKAGRKAKGQMQQGYFWPVYGEADEVCFPFSPTRAASQVPAVLGENFSGVLVSDGYAAYSRYVSALPGVTHAQCWAHARRGFERAQESDPQAVAEALHIIAALYRQEAWIREHKLEGPDKQKARTQRCEPIVKEFWHWCDRQCHRPELIPSHPLAKALRYAMARRESMEVFLSDPDVPIDSNHIERALRPIPMGRKSWLFCWTEVGAKYVGVIQSLLSTCRLQGVHPYTYLVDVLQRIGQHPAREVIDLTPRRWKELFAANPLRSDADLAEWIPAGTA